MKNKLQEIRSNRNLNMKTLEDVIKEISLINDQIDIISKYLIGEESIFSLLNIEKIWNKGYKGEGIKVALIDTNFKNIQNKLSFKQIYNPNGNVIESYGHGTKVASLIAGKDIGLAPNVELYGCLAIGDISPNQIKNINKCLRWCIDNNMDVINISQNYGDGFVAGDDYKDVIAELESLCKEADNKKIIIVCGCGNNGSGDNIERSGIPAKLESTISISSVNTDLTYSKFSSTSKTIDFASIGNDVNVYSENGELIKASGTSFATPLATAIIALMKQQNKNISRLDVLELCKKTCISISGLEKNIYFGNGLIQGTLIPEDYVPIKIEEDNPIEDDSNTEQPEELSGVFLLDNLNVTKLHNKGIKGKGIKIAMIGWGCSNFSDFNIYKYVNLTSDKKTNMICAQNPLGNICTSIIASKTLGIAPESEVYILRDREENGLYPKTSVGKDIKWCLNNNIDIVFTNVYIKPEYLKQLSDKGIICVMSCYKNQLSIAPGQYTGNENAITVSYVAPENKFVTSPTNAVPYKASNIDCVGYGYGFEYMNAENTKIELTKSNYPAAQWRTMFAAYQVIGILALMKQQYPKLNTAIKARKLLQYLCTDLGYNKSKQGYGLIKAELKSILNLQDNFFD